MIGAILLVQTTLKVNAAPPPTGIKNVVLVHGAFADGSGWETVANILKKDGYTVSVVQHPETSFAEDVKFTKAEIDRQPGPVVLVGHSYGGAVITEAGNNPKVSALVYIAAFAPDTGESAASLEQAVPPAGKGIKESADGYFYIDPASFAADFCADVPPAKAEFMAKSQVLFSKDSFTSPVTTPAWKSKPSWYLVATQDRSINPENERKMAKRANAKTTEVIRATRPTSLIRRKRPSSLKKLPPPRQPIGNVGQRMRSYQNILEAWKSWHLYDKSAKS